MSVVTVKIGNNNYQLSCSPGEEQHLRYLSEKLDKRYKALNESLKSKAGDNLTLVILALTIEDELLNSRKKINENNDSYHIAIESIKKIDQTIAKLRNLQKSA